MTAAPGLVFKSPQEYTENCMAWGQVSERQGAHKDRPRGRRRNRREQGEWDGQKTFHSPREVRCSLALFLWDVSRERQDDPSQQPMEDEALSPSCSPK